MGLSHNKQRKKIVKIHLVLVYCRIIRLVAHVTPWTRPKKILIKKKSSRDTYVFKEIREIR
jgi:hypothetical protein